MYVQYWVCEHTTIVKSDSPNAIPRILKWKLPDLQKAMKQRTLGKLKAKYVSLFKYDKFKLICPSYIIVISFLCCHIIHLHDKKDCNVTM